MEKVPMTAQGHQMLEAELQRRQSHCNQCGKCREVCPDDAVRHNDDRYEIDYDFCKGCGICAYECKAEAIEILPEEK